MSLFFSKMIVRSTTHLTQNIACLAYDVESSLWILFNVSVIIFSVIIVTGHCKIVEMLFTLNTNHIVNSQSYDKIYDDYLVKKLMNIIQTSLLC